MEWTDEVKEALRELMSQRLNGSQIAKLMSERFNHPFTRSMVHGAAHRNGWQFTFLKEAKKPLVTPIPKPKVVKMTAEKLVLVEVKKPIPPATEGGCTILELTRQRCRYPLWDDTAYPDTSFQYCGAKVSDPPYCKTHAEIVYRPNRFLGS